MSDNIDNAQEKATWIYNRYGHVTLIHPDGRDVYFQIDTDVAAFFDHIGLNADDIEIDDSDDVDFELVEEYFSLCQ